MDFAVENEGATLVCREVCGQDVCADAVPIVCVHGACVDKTFFDGFACELGRIRRVITYDRRGSGESSVAADSSYDVAAQAEDLAAVIERVGTPCDILAHSAGALMALELLGARPELVRRAILHEPAVSGEGVGLGTSPVVLKMIEAGKISRALMLFLNAIGDSDPEAPKLTPAEVEHALRNGRCFMANEYATNMTYVPDWEKARASGSVAAVCLGELSIGTPREEGTRAAAALLGCPIVTLPGAHNGFGARPRGAAPGHRRILGS